MAVTTTELLAGIKRLITMPASQVLLADTDILAIADDVIMREVVPVILSSRQEYLMQDPYTTATVADQAAYSLPARAIGRSLRDFKLVNSSSNATNLFLIKLEDEHLYSTSSGTPVGFYFRGDKVVLVPPPSSTAYTLKMWYHLKPSDLVALSAVGTVTSIADPIVNVNATPTAIVSGSVIDFVQGISGNTILGFDAAVDSVTSTSITFAASTIPSTLAVGDYISLASQAPVLVGIPDEAYPWLKMEVGAECLYSIGDYEGQGKLKDQSKRQREAFLQIIEPRIVGEPTKIINRSGLLRRRGIYSRRSSVVV